MSAEAMHRLRELQAQGASHHIVVGLTAPALASLIC